LLSIAFATAAAQGPPYVVSGSQLIREGRLQEALAGYSQAVAATPKSTAANSGAAVVLDLLGRYQEARTYFAQAIRWAATPDEKVKIERALAISYGFTRDCRGAEKADRTAYEYFLNQPDYYSAGEVADELGRLCLDSGDTKTAYDWYRRGHDTGLREANIPKERKDLWEFRWAHARARIAARQNKPEELRKYIAAAKAILDKGSIPDQQIYFPYLTGYVAFYAGDYPVALNELLRADRTDPFIVGLLAQTYEKLGDDAKALEFYRQAANATAHSVAVALARPIALSNLSAR
jgi:Flp pilus assembly protein TadD